MSFSLTYLLTKEDFSSYEKKLKIATYLNRFKSMLLPLILIVAAGIFMGSGYIFSGIFFFLAMIVFPDIINSEYKNKTAKASLLLKKPITVEFYEDHFVVRCDPDEISKSFSEKHYGFDTVVNVFEAEDYFYFIFSTNNILIVPKRVLSDEEKDNIKNLIDNLFAEKYRMI